jgi:polyisoprenoid-binding protein YceI
MRAAAHERQPVIRRSRPRPELWHAGPRESELRFSLRHFVLAKISGRIRRWRASFVIDLAQPSRSSIEVVVDASSLETGTAERDELTRSAAFLNVARFPEIQFHSREVRRRDGGRQLSVTGDLTIRDVTREVEVEVERLPTVAAQSHVSKLSFKGHVSIRRQDFGLRWYSEREKGGLLAGDHVDIDFEVNARRGAK